MPTNSSDINPFYTGESSNANNGTHNLHLKLAFPKFNGEDASGWIYKAEQYFDFKGVAPDQQNGIARGGSEISFHAIAGANHPQTIRVLGKLKNRELMERIKCAGLCRDLTVIIQGTPITADYYVLLVAVCPLVLGVQGLATLGPIKTEYSKLTMMLQQAGVQCTFQGLSQGGIDVFTDEDFYHMQGPCFFLHLVATTDTNGAQ
ncbi:hypothetical protein FEM48_Zijuj05G0136100 [Ziziphus jujuba var. spinosa]|uniref:Uncharacterized protein n=1 Tax=Ziziphus jujuba var. spinosa TaxID=714518 RepID=A0A978VF52_ZIZJJ|nr:hypothetical protein FEM48_Zijuj05G0136100 [Ziziphus jujuba var. spinosa]